MRCRILEFLKLVGARLFPGLPVPNASHGISLLLVNDNLRNFCCTGMFDVLLLGGINAEDKHENFLSPTSSRSARPFSNAETNTETIA